MMHILSRKASALRLFFFFFNDTATTEIYTLSLHDALPISRGLGLEKEWSYEPKPLVDCPACGEKVKPGVAVCRACGAILDRAKALQFGLLPAEAGPAVPSLAGPTVPISCDPPPHGRNVVAGTFPTAEAQLKAGA